MRCEAFEHRLQHLLDERQLPELDALLADHACVCPACREMLDAQAGLFDTVRDWSVADLEVDLVDRVLVRAAPAASQPKRRSWWPLSWRRGAARWISLAVAAALVAVAWQGYQWYGPRIARPAASESVESQSADPSGREDSPEPSQRDAGPSDLPQPRSLAIGPLAREAAEGLGFRIAWGVHYLHRGRAVVADVILGQFPRKAAAEPNGRSSTLLYNATGRSAIV